MIAQTLLHEPSLLILDEPTAGLDPRQRVAVRETLKGMRPATSTIISTHMLEDVADLADHVLVLDGGSIVFAGSPDDLANLRGLPGDPNPLPCCVALAAILAAALVGGLLGTTNARGLEPVVAVVAILALIYGVRLAGGRTLIDIGGVSVVLIGVRHRSVVTLWQMAFYLSLIGTLSLALTSSWTRSKARMVLAIGATALVGLSLVVAVPVRFEGSPNQWVCDPATPRVCVSAEDANRLAEYAPAVRRIAKVAPLVGLETHAKYRQTVGITCGPGSFSLDPALSMHQLTFDFVQFSVPCSGQWGTAQLDDADMVADWLRAELSLPMSVLGQERGRPSVEDARAALDRLECSP